MILTKLRYKFSQNIVLQYNDLKAGKNLTQLIQTAYGPKGHGILFVQGIPDYLAIRKSTLPLFSKIPNLPESILNKYKRPQIFHSLGWSHGVQKFNGRFDTAKGSYYVNCCKDEPEKISSENLKYYSEDELKINVGNRWIDEIPEIQLNVKTLSKLMIEVGVMLAKQIDVYASKNIETYEKDHLTRIISQGHSHIGRILHYFPYDTKGQTQDDWCGWHNDHGSLTALTSAMYIDEEGQQILLKTNTGGLFAQNRFSELARIAIPQNMLAFQLGESTQIHTGGYLEATPHCVVRSEEIAGKNISRNTFALFMEPDHLQKMKTPKNINPQKVLLTKQHNIPQIKERWENGVFFKDFHLKTIQHYS